MKIIVLERGFEEKVDVPCQSHIMADSALVVAGRPLFLPDYADKWKIRVYTAYRVSRLGKTVKRRFASRYYDGCSLALRLIPVDETFCSIEWFADNSLALSPFTQISEDDNNPHLALGDVSFIHHPDQIDSAIEQVTHFSTIKNGDLILSGYKELDVEIAPRMDFNGIIGNQNFTIALR